MKNILLVLIILALYVNFVGCKNGYSNSEPVLKEEVSTIKEDYSKEEFSAKAK